MKVAVTGSTGMLGYAVSEYFSSLGWSVLKLGRKEFDLAKGEPQALEKLLQDNKIEVLINCAGVIKPQIAKTPIEDVLKVNSIMPHNMGKIAQKLQIKAFHITTDCVYSGAKGAYNEDDYFDATDVYGMSKNGGEPTTLMTLRTSIIGEEKGQSRSLLEWARSQKGKEVNGFVNHDWNGVTTLQVAKSIHAILDKGAYKPGLFHLHSKKALNKFELLQVFNETYSLGLKINSVTAADRIDRTLASRYSLSGDFVNRSIAEQVKEMAEFFKTRPA
jgi:dTDP-4-dehydrorhamnose reductase